MSGYRYKPTAAERKAVERLRAKGWRVTEPVCPLCYGFGSISTVHWEGNATVSTGGWFQKPCPNGCSSSGMYYAVTGDTFTSTTTTTIVEDLS